MSGSKSSPEIATTVRLGRLNVSRLSWQGGLSNTLHTLTQFLSREMWVWPLIAAIVLGFVGWWTYRVVGNGIRKELAGNLTAILKTEVHAVRLWMDSKQAIAQATAADPLVRATVSELITTTRTLPNSEAALLQAKPLTDLRRHLQPRLQALKHDDFLVADNSLRIVAAAHDAAIGKTLQGSKAEFFGKVLKGKAAVSLPFISTMAWLDAKGEPTIGRPTMIVAAPLESTSGTRIGVIGFRLRPEGEFADIFKAGRPGETGETYAFNESGLLITQSRFDDMMKQWRLLSDAAEVHSLLNIEVRDPGVNMVEGGDPQHRRSDQPLTKMAANATAGNSGFDVNGYRDYRGVPVIGAWTWLPEYGMGITTEVDVAEAFQPLYVLRFAFGTLLLFLIATAGVIFLFAMILSRKHRDLQKAVVAAKQLGQYAIEDKIGTGGMGSVYRARHALLRRPTAVKLLNIEKMSEGAMIRFEREVQLTSRLNHPNTITIYDYGRTPEGLFFYAMEYLDGINLDELVSQYGPLPDGRVVSILVQVCGSLAEAHGLGLIHRDIKPANIFLTTRGGIRDFVKVLDFGLVKAVGSAQTHLTATQSLTGTPLYISPEAIEEPNSVDARADIYAIGAVGYYLLTGTPVFSGESLMEVCLHHVRTTPEPPSRRVGRTLSSELEQLILQCLAKKREDRPVSVQVLLEQLDECMVSRFWTPGDAREWWEQRNQPPPTKITEIVNLAERMTMDEVPETIKSV